MNTITRRTALAVPVTLPLLPVSAFATPADPAVAAYREWLAAYHANDAFLAAGKDDETPEGQAMYNRVCADPENHHPDGPEAGHALTLKLGHSVGADQCSSGCA